MLLIAANVAIFVILKYALPENYPTLAVKLHDSMILDATNPKLHQFLTYAFHHAGWGHLLGNMFFLYIFGNSLNDKLGHAKYLLFYLASAIFVAAAYCLISDQRMLGASGAIAAVTTGFLILFPRSRILVLYVFFFIGTFETSSLFLIVFKMILFDNVIDPRLGDAGRVAYEAHLIGYFFGLCTPLLLLALRALPRDQFDILSLWSRMLRRRQYRRAVRSTEKPLWVGLKQARPVRSESRDSRPKRPTAEADRIQSFRSKIDDALKRYDLATAAEGYRELVALDAQSVLSRRQQLDVANQLMAEKRFSDAAHAYEKYIVTYPTGEQIHQVRLLLGIIYARHVLKPPRAKELLEQALPGLTDPAQRSLCQTEIDQLNV